MYDLFPSMLGMEVKEMSVDGMFLFSDYFTNFHSSKYFWVDHLTESS